MSSSPEVRILGVDPGINGAAAIFCPRSIVKVPPQGIIRLPTVERELSKKTPGGRRRVMRTIDGAKFLGWVQYHQPTHAFVEQVWAMPPKVDEETGEQRGAGNTSSFNFGRAYGSVLTVIECFGLKPVDTVSQRWQKFHGLNRPDIVARELRLPAKADKGEVARQYAMHRHPFAIPFMKFKSDHNSAEALLIAEYGAFIVGRLEGDDIEE